MKQEEFFKLTQKQKKEYQNLVNKYLDIANNKEYKTKAELKKSYNEAWKKAYKEFKTKKKKPLSARMVTTKVKKPFKKSPTGASKQVANFPIRDKPGAYIIFEGKKVIYVGYGKNVYMAMYRHFYPYRDKLPQSRVYFENKEKLKCQVIYTKTAAQAHKLEIALIFKYNPPLNLNKYKGFEADESEKKILTEYYLTPSKDIEIYKGDIPF